MDCNAGAALSRAFVQQGVFPQGDFGMGFGDGSDQVMGGPAHAEMMDHGPTGGCPANWAEQFHHQRHADPHHAASSMEQEFAAMMHHQDEVEAAAAHAEMEAAFAAAESHHAEAESAGDWLQQFEGAEPDGQWAQEFNAEDVQTFSVEGEPVKTVAEKTKESQFYAFMEKVKRGEIVIDDEKGIVEGPAQDWAQQFEKGEGVGALSEEHWAEELAQHYDGRAEEDDAEYDAAWNDADAQRAEEEAHERAWGSDGDDEDFAERYLQAAKENGADNWLEEYQQSARMAQQAYDSSDYPFDPNNPYLFHDDPFGEGMQLLAAGTLSEAVLAFEAACQQKPDREDAWRVLGTTQAENEKDQLAIRALNRARELNPKDLAVHLALSVSHTNESNHTQALQALKGWLLANPQYEQLGSITMDQPDVGPDEFSREFLFISPSEHRDCCTLFNAAREINPRDAELHVCLGILKNLSHEFDEAAQHFQDALQFRQDDPKLWNKLGATLANGNRSREALAAYDRALDLNPGYVRAQYNLGIAHSNLGDHVAAARHLVRAVVMQQGGIVVPDPPTRSTREMWDVLRMTLNLMDRGDLVEKTWSQDVVPFLHEFGLSDLL
jgi:peroxin-5